MKTDGTQNMDFYWQGGYAAFSISQSNVTEVIRYIENQEELCPGLVCPGPFGAIVSRQRRHDALRIAPRLTVA